MMYTHPSGPSFCDTGMNHASFALRKSGSFDCLYVEPSRVSLSVLMHEPCRLPIKSFPRYCSGYTSASYITSPPYAAFWCFSVEMDGIGIVFGGYGPPCRT